MTRPVTDACRCDDQGTLCLQHEIGRGSQAAKRAEHESAVLRSLARFDVATMDEIYGGCGGAGITKTAMQRIVKAMVDDGRIVLVRRGAYRRAA
jgi:hypothetical protein